MLTLQDVIKITTLSSATIYRALARGDFPRPVKIGLRRIAWRKSDIEAFLGDAQSAAPR